MGFTLIELLIVVAILGVLAATIIPNVGRFMGRGDTEARRTEYHNVSSAVIAMMVDNSITTIPGALTYTGDVAANSMSGFPDPTTTAANKGLTAGSANAGYILYQHDHVASDGTTVTRINYVTMGTTRWYYTCETDGSVRQFDKADLTDSPTEYTN